MLKAGRLETLNFKSEGFPKLIPEAVRDSHRMPASASILGNLTNP